MKLLTTLVCLLAAVTLSAHAEVTFLRGPLKDAIARAEAEKKPVLIDFMTDWCRWCDTLDAKTYSDARVSGFVNANLVPFKIDAEKGEGIELAKKYNVHAYPTILLIRPDGEEIDRLLGYMPPDTFLKSLDDYLQGINTIGSLRAALEKNPGDVSIQYAMAKKFSDRGDLATAAAYYRKVLELDPADAAKHAQEASLMLGMNALRTAKDPSELLAFTHKYPDAPETRQALMSLNAFSVREKKPDDARKYAEMYLAKWPDDAAAMNNFAWGLAEQKMQLEYAATLAAKAVSLAKTDDEKAMYLDTQATAEFNRGNAANAITLEQKALGLLKNATAKDRKGYEDTLAKFKAGTSAAAGK